MLIKSIFNVNWVQKYVHSGVAIIRQRYQFVKLMLIEVIFGLSGQVHHNLD